MRREAMGASAEGPSDLAEETGATAAWSTESAKDADLVIVSIPQKNVPDVPAGIVGSANPGAPGIETNNHYPQQRDGLIEAIEDGKPESVWVSEHLGSPVLKVFNGIYWKHLPEKGTSSGTAGRIPLPIAGAEDAGK